MNFRQRIKQALSSYWRRRPVRKFRPYLHLERLEMMDKPQRILDKWLSFEEKRDGSCLTFWLDDDDETIHISSRNMAQASNDLANPAKATEDYPRIVEFLRDGRSRYILYAELIPKGKGPTRIEGEHGKAQLVVFDIWDIGIENYLGYVQLYQQCCHYNMPVVERWGYANFISLKSYDVFRDEVLRLAKELHREGTVIKYVNQSPIGDRYIYWKEKIDIPPRPKLTHNDNATPDLPLLPETEVLGELSKLQADFGIEWMRDKSKCMPELAKRVSQAAKENLCRPRSDIFRLYLDYLRERSS
jgi:hypothetical protein